MLDTNTELNNKQQAYENFLKKIEDIEAYQSNERKNIFNNLDDREFFVKWFGCEVISIYVTPQDDNHDFNRKQIFFLYESVRDSLDFPMFSIAPKSPKQPPFENFVEVNEQVRHTIRSEQKKVLKSVEERTSAELCAKYLRADEKLHYILLPFGEILIYCFLYHVLENNKINQNDWIKNSINSWDTLIEVYKTRFDNFSLENVSSKILKILLQWYSKDKIKPCYDRQFLGVNKVDAIYNDLSDDLKNLLEKSISEEGIRTDFLQKWATLLYDSFNKSIDGNNEKKSFFGKALINPKIEELLSTKGLYVTIVRSPIRTKENNNSNPDPISEAYVICTIFDSSSFEENKPRQDLDRLLRRISYREVARYDYDRLKNVSDNQILIQKLFNKVSSRDETLDDLLHECCRIGMNISNANFILISLNKIGTFILSKYINTSDENKKFDNPKIIYVPKVYGSSGRVTSESNKNGLYDSLEEYRKNKEHPNYLIEFSKFISDKISVDFNLELNILFSPITDKDLANQKDDADVQDLKRLGVIILYTESKDSLSTINGFLKQLSIAISIGMSMPYRNMVNKGLIGMLIRYLIQRWRNLFPSSPKIEHKPPKPRSKLKIKWHVNNPIDTIIATMLELTQIGFLLVGIMFLLSVWYLIWPQLIPFWHNKDSNTVITEVLHNVEATVMAFSICLASTGIIFLMRPEISVGQPKWMQRFSKPGNLEHTLVRLAAMVLTIDVLSVILKLQIFLQSSTTYLWTLVKPAMFHLIAYLVVLLGLAFLTKFLLNEKKERKKQRNL